MVRVRCPKCGYEWDYKGRLKLATCPNCGRKLAVDRCKVKVDGEAD
jgi:ssDNA-binding Zn-finger/Zn-ribbon topoisomerase 1